MNVLKQMIDIKLFATLQPFAPPNASCYPVQAGSSIETLIEMLNLPRDQIRLIFLNGMTCSLDTILQNGDRVGIFPPVGGG